MRKWRQSTDNPFNKSYCKKRRDDEIWRGTEIGPWRGVSLTLPTLTRWGGEGHVD